MSDYGKWGSLWKDEKPAWTIAKLRKAINANCRWCNGVPGAWVADVDCTDPDCPWYPFRPGDGPGRIQKRSMSKRQREQLAFARRKSPVGTQENVPEIVFSDV